MIYLLINLPYKTRGTVNHKNMINCTSNYTHLFINLITMHQHINILIKLILYNNILATNIIYISLE